ncbi:MAG: cysteine--tRNA ligase [Thermodesulfobacteriota bacterium]
MCIKIYNSLTRKKDEFKPLKDGEVSMYVCGPTVYDFSHIGHARSAVTFDIIYRYLQYRGYNVKYARNYTDIDDKIINRANEQGVSWETIAERYIKAFDEDMDALCVALPTYRPKATDTIPQIIALVQKLIDKNYAYTVEGTEIDGQKAFDVYYRVRNFKEYGKLSGKNIECLESGARIEVDDRKEDPLDFALWKASKPGEPAWDSPWGKGRPGWHIECSAMSQSLLGDTIDIHGGGKDLIFPHHENEIAQSEAATGEPFVRCWIHNGFVNIDEEKMSKSLGNILNIQDTLKAYSPEAVRLFLISSHYRSPIDYTPDTLSEAESTLERYYITLERMDKEWPEVTSGNVDKETKKERIQPFLNAMDDDFNTAIAIGRIFDEVHAANRLMDRAGQEGVDELNKYLPIIRDIFKEVGSFLGVFHRSSEEYFEEKKNRLTISEDEVNSLIRERKKARENKDWKRADEIRAKLDNKGVSLEDTSEGTVWRVR